MFDYAFYYYYYSCQNRQSYSQLPEDVKASVVKGSPVRVTGKGRGKGDAKLVSKDINSESSQVKERASAVPETFKSFCIRFVRLNGILFTRTRYQVESLLIGFYN